MNVYKPVLVLVAALMFVGGCARWSHGWDMKAWKSSGRQDVEEVKTYAARLEKSAVTRDQVQRLIESLKYVVAAEPDNLDATVRLAQAWIVKGVGHSRDSGDKGDSLRRAITISERAMSLDPAFVAAVRAVPGGKGKVSDAIGTLDAKYASAAAVWALATLLYYEESLSEVLKITNRHLIDDVAAVLNWMDRVAPAYGEGMTLALRGMAAAVSPGAQMVNVSDMFDAAVVAGPKSMLNLWLRGVYLYRNFGDKVSEGADFKAIRDLKPEEVPGFVPLNRMIRLSVERTSRWN